MPCSLFSLNDCSGSRGDTTAAGRSPQANPVQRQKAESRDTWLIYINPLVPGHILYKNTLGELFVNCSEVKGTKYNGAKGKKDEKRKKKKENCLKKGVRCLKIAPYSAINGKIWVNKL